MLTGATVTRLVQRDGSVVAVEVAALSGAGATIQAGIVVLAGGAIENPACSWRAGSATTAPVAI